MILLPAIDLLGGRVVRLEQGSYDKVTVYNDDPFAQACEFERQGASWVHVVDLDGARTGVPAHADIIKRIASETGLSVEVGGGIRTLETARVYADAGADHLVLGTALIKDPDFARQAADEFGDLIVAGIDAKGGDVAIEGWQSESGVPVGKLVSALLGFGIRRLVYTDISRDGMQTGIDVSRYEQLAQMGDIEIIASGGISTLDDIKALAGSGTVWGAITGRAVYEGAFSVAEALKVISDVEGSSC